MAWACELCGREFTRRKQLHSCRSYNIDHAFSGIGQRWLPFYRRVLSLARERLPPFSEHFPAVGVLWRGPSTFAEFRYTKDELFVFFSWDSLRVECGPVGYFQMSTNRVAHQVAVTEENLDGILGWIADSYMLTQSQQ